VYTHKNVFVTVRNYITTQYMDLHRTSIVIDVKNHTETIESTNYIYQVHASFLVHTYIHI
jgi:hypothetical protein